ncbi:YmfQ family protein [Paenibacillus spongiae]|uniref:YmfQ family protein n=1 Tax=Paenibacillus spongiae TaxID=2909671 RepID=A0ABY5SDR0_9BACL|nr:YmfQ family protein [Paenibacillus spongiae]UVI32096.1 YmfQ family protein [Paenibacillus spongiae]
MMMGNIVKSYVIPLYGESRVTGNNLAAGAVVLQQLETSIDGVLDQMFVDTATYGLAKWEKFLGIQIDELKPIEQRKSVIISKIRGIGTVTKVLIKSVAESYSNGEVDVLEDSANYTVTIAFVSTRGIPPNITDIQNAIRDIIPAHLAINYEFTYITWDEINAMNKTWDEWDALGLTWDELETYKP